MALDEKGFHRPTFEQILSGKIKRAKELFGNDIDTSELTPLGKFLRLDAYDDAEIYETAEGVYYARFPNTARGVSLDRLLPFAGITRNTATRAEHEIKIIGQADFPVPNGSIFGTLEGVTFYLVNDVTLDSSGSGTGTVACTAAGTVGNVPLGTINELVNPIAGVNSIEHTDILKLGEDGETDIALRIRFQQAISGAGSTTMESIKGHIMRIDGVKSCSIVENSTDSTDSGGRPPHSFEVFVYAPDELNEEIAQAIFEKKPVGISTVGKTSCFVSVSTSGEMQEIRFSHMSEIVIHIKITVKKDGAFAGDSINNIKTALITHIQGLAGGQDVILSELYGKIFAVSGVRDVASLQLSTDGASWSAGNVTLTAEQVATTNAESITVEVQEYADH